MLGRLHQSEQSVRNSIFTFSPYWPQRHSDCHPQPRLLLSHHQSFPPVFLRRKIVGGKNINQTILVCRSYLITITYIICNPSGRVILSSVPLGNNQQMSTEIWSMCEHRVTSARQPLRRPLPAAAHGDHEFFESRWNCAASQGTTEISKATTVTVYKSLFLSASLQCCKHLQVSSTNKSARLLFKSLEVSEKEQEKTSKQLSDLIF